MALIQKIYPEESEDTHQLIYEELSRQLKGPADAKAPSLGDTLCGANYRYATWVCLSVAFANTMSGVNIINIYV